MTATKLEGISNDNKMSMPNSEDIMNKPWLDDTFLFANAERAIIRERLNISSIMNLKPLVIRPEVANNSYNSLSSKKLDALYNQHILSNY